MRRDALLSPGGFTLRQTNLTSRVLGVVKDRESLGIYAWLNREQGRLISHADGEFGF